MPAVSSPQPTLPPPPPNISHPGGGVGVGQRDRWNFRTLVTVFSRVSKARFRPRTFHEPNIELSTWKVRRLNQLGTTVVIWNGSRFFPPRPAGNFDYGSTLKPLWFRPLTFHVPNLMHSYDVFCEQFDRDKYFSPSEISSAGIKIGVWINSTGLNNLGRP